MLFTCERGTDIHFEKCHMLSSTSFNRSCKFLKRYHPSLFCKFNPKTGFLEIWDEGFNGFKYLVKVLKTEDGKFREPDYRDLVDLDKRSYERRGMHNMLEDEVDRKDEEFEAWRDQKQRHENFDISMEKFNTVMSNPVIGGH
jgi:hypothetical protein